MTAFEYELMNEFYLPVFNVSLLSLKVWLWNREVELLNHVLKSLEFFSTSEDFLFFAFLFTLERGSDFPLGRSGPGLGPSNAGALKKQSLIFLNFT